MSAPRERRVNTAAKPFNLSASKAGRHSKEAITAKVREEASKELTFKPKTLSRPSTPSRQEGMSRQERIAQLSTPRTAQWEKYEKLRAEHKASETKDCTFHPNINRKPKKMAGVFGSVPPRPSTRGADNVDRASMPVPDRLYMDADNRYRARENAKRQLAEAEVASFPFQPAINDNSRAAIEAEGYRPIHERVGELMRKKQESLAAARVQMELENPDLTFAPKVSDASRAIARGLEEEAGVDPRHRIDRLSSGASFTSERAMRRTLGYGGQRSNEGEGDDHTFKPHLNENTRRLCEMMAEEGVRGGAGSFLERQAEHAAKSRKEKEGIRARYDEECTFHPNTGNAEEVLKRSQQKMTRLGETPAERVARLAYQDKKEKEHKQKVAEENYYKQFTHKPKLSKAARKVDAVALEEAAWRREQRRLRAEEAAEEAFREEYTFEPNKDRKHTDAAPRPYQVDYSKEDGITARIREYHREKEICLQEARAEKEFKELQECTFHPNVGMKTKLSGIGEVGATKSVAEVVNGLGRYLERRQRAKQLEEQARARAKKVFLEDVRDKVVSHRQTIPVPYNISAHGEAGLKAEIRYQRLLAEKEEREMGSCTFRPKTNERPRKELIEKLLAESEDELDGSPHYSSYRAY